VLGAWPVSAQRLDDYLVKAAREAKVATTWTAPDEAYEARLLRLGAACREEPGLADAFETWVVELAPAERSVNLAAKLLQLTLPGVPDVYRGCEVVARRLVDPDNRQPVDFDDRADRLAALDAGRQRTGLDDDKLWVTSRALRLRRELPEAFGPGAGYHPLEPASDDLLGFRRGDRVLTLVSLRPLRPLGRTASPAQQDVSVALPGGSWRDVLTDRVHRDVANSGDLFGDLPVALLRREDDA
jgi:(1->4)-alpha-D-glucan 1-alpha-D-glucosylmutase